MDKNRQIESCKGEKISVKILYLTGLIVIVPLNNPCQYDFCIMITAMAADDATERPELKIQLYAN